MFPTGHNQAPCSTADHDSSAQSNGRCRFTIFCALKRASLCCIGRSGWLQAQRMKESYGACVCTAPPSEYSARAYARRETTRSESDAAKTSNRYKPHCIGRSHDPHLRIVHAPTAPTSRMGLRSRTLCAVIEHAAPSRRARLSQQAVLQQQVCGSSHRPERQVRAPSDLEQRMTIV